MAPPLLDTFLPFHGGETVTGDGLRALFLFFLSLSLSLSSTRRELFCSRFFRLSGGMAGRYIRGWVLFEMVIRKGR